MPPPFTIDNTNPTSSSIVSAYPSNERTHRSVLADWLSYLSDPATGTIRTEALPGGVDNFPAGTKMLFQQTAAPTGWTKDTTHNNKALRLVNGTVGSGGTRTFTSVFADDSINTGNTAAGGTVGNTTLTLSQIPSHNHTVNPPVTSTTENTHDHNFGRRGTGEAQTSNQYFQSGGASFESGTYDMQISNNTHSHNVDIPQFDSGNSGGGGSHTHSFTGSNHAHTVAQNFAVAYVDFIIATKDAAE